MFLCFLGLSSVSPSLYPQFLSHPHFWCVLPALVPLSWQAELGCSMPLKPQPWEVFGAGTTGERQNWGWTALGSITLPFLLGPSCCSSLERCWVPRAPLCPKLGEPGSSVSTRVGLLGLPE